MGHEESSPNLSRAAALDLFREGRVSLGRAAELCGTPLADFMDFAAAHGVPPLNSGLEQFEEDMATLERVRRGEAEWARGEYLTHEEAGERLRRLLEPKE
jgi:predicted HTH domain antitoxin